MPERLLIWNSSAGTAAFANQLRNHPALRDAQRVVMSRSMNLNQQINQAVADGCRQVVAAGGDGTVNAVVNAMMSVPEGVRPELAILPLGTANDFAGSLGIPDNPRNAVELIGRWQAKPVDVARIEADGWERYFANVAAGGNSVRVTEEITDDLKQQWGAFVYLRGAIDVLTHLTSFRITADCDGEVFKDINSWAVLVANGRTNAGRILVAPKASLVDGLLDVVIFRGGTTIDLLTVLSNAVLGDFTECEQIIYRQVRQLRLSSTPSMRFTLDGEVIDREPVVFEVVPGAIRMVVGY